MNAFITGGSRGIGRSIVLKFVKEGWGVAFTYVGNREGADETIRLAKEIRADVKIQAYQLDQKDPDKVETVVEQAINDFEEFVALVNNAAAVRNNAAAIMTNEEWDEVIRTDLSGPFYVSRSFLMHFIPNRKGRIVFISSLAQHGCSGQANYAAAKAGLIGLAQTLGKEYGPKGITANVVTVGLVETDMTRDHLASHLMDFWMKYCPLKKVGTGDEIANAVYFLSSDESGFINCEVLRVSGGLIYAP